MKASDTTLSSWPFCSLNYSGESEEMRGPANFQGGDPVIAPSNFLASLRDAVWPSHARLEKRVGIEQRLASVPAYTSLLRDFYGFYQPLELLLAREVRRWSVQVDYGQRRKTPLLVRDLQALGVMIPTLRCDQLPTLATGAAVWGCLYVLEGATLGGHVIARRLSPLRVTPQSGGSFFHGYGAAVGAMWAQFRGLLSSHVQTAREQDECIQSALATFSAFEVWLALIDASPARTSPAASLPERSES